MKKYVLQILLVALISIVFVSADKIIENGSKYTGSAHEINATNSHFKPIHIYQKDVVWKGKANYNKISTFSMYTMSGLGISLFVSFFLINGFLIFERIQLKKKLEDQQAQGNERLIISRDLHDNVGAQLSATMMFLSDMRKITVEGKARKLLDSSMGLLETSIRDLRSVMEEWHRSESVERSFVAAVEGWVLEIKRTHNIHFVLSHHGLDNILSPLLKHTLLRITHEFIENTIKYAQADRVILDFVLKPEKLVLTYEDNGKGFDQLSVPMGYGLSSMESKILSMDGFLEINTSPGNGFMAIIEIPVSGEV
ncbi:MAG: hypothetical protein IPN36_02125 [Bacteroidetes bacterium]|nr:hypothetical protein [Bacteroidota bacterium]MBL0096084.1 hypothetical protein [Bacteroidota bacterium]